MATYAVAASVCDASMAEMSARDAFGSPAIETSLHVFPLSRVTWMRPLFVPTQIVPGATVDGEIDSIIPPRGVRLAAASLAASTGSLLFGRPRSGLSFRQCTPPSVVAMRYWNPASSSCWFHGAKTIGLLLVARSSSDGSMLGLTLIHCSLGYAIFTIPEPLAYTVSGWSGSGTIVPHSHPGTGLQSSGVIS